MAASLLCAGLIVAPWAHAEDENFSPRWTVSCADKGRGFELDFRSASGVGANNDMVVSLKTTRGQRAKLALKAALYHPRGGLSAVKNLCKGGDDGNAVVAFKLEGNLALLWLSEDNRPGLNVLTLALVDIEQGQVLDVNETHAEIKDADGVQRLAIRPVKDAYQIRVVREWMENTGEDEAPEAAIEDWLNVAVKNRRIVIGWRDGK